MDDPIPVGMRKARGNLKSVAHHLAYRNLFHDRLSLVVTLIGIVFAVVLLSFQSGIYLGIERTIAAVIDEAVKAKEENKEKVILFNLSGHGFLDISAYEGNSRK